MDSKIIYHYTFGLTPKPVFKGAAEWRLDKRMFYGAYPSDHLEMPPACTAKSGFVIASMWNEAPEMACKCSPRRHAPPFPTGSSSPLCGTRPRSTSRAGRLNGQRRPTRARWAGSLMASDDL